MDNVEYASLLAKIQKSVGSGTGGANVQSDWNESNASSDSYIKNKPTIPTKTSELLNDSGFVNHDTTYDIATSESDGLMSSIDKTKLNNLETAEMGTWAPAISGNGSISVNAANYVYDGNTCTVIARISVGSDVTGDTINLVGLPFLPKHDSAASVYMARSNEAISGYVSAPNKNLAVRSTKAFADQLIFITATFIVV